MRDSIILIAVLLLTWLPSLILFWWLWRIVGHVNLIGARVNEIAQFAKEIDARLDGVAWHVNRHCEMDQRLREALVANGERIDAQIRALLSRMPGRN